MINSKQYIHNPSFQAYIASIFQEKGGINKVAKTYT